MERAAPSSSTGFKQYNLMNIINRCIICLALAVSCVVSPFAPLKGETATPAATSRNPDQPRALRDPFFYAGGAPAPPAVRGQVPVRGNYLPPGIRVKSTLRLAGGEAVAVLEIPGYPNLFHLHEGEQFSLDGNVSTRSPRRAGASPARPANTGAAAPVSPAPADAPVTFTVEEISRHTVTVSQSRRPDELIVIR
ncbi:hypothetical protein AW736_07185 [Termitidicoccus mucosus]|uniref:Uncharacterized protein n=2 Tax=Termitidicoccus mucosus TaxID=1184151 RepID=A0A178ILD4_9BACT|nr:hypothetical protein AW736_07185 [Opitutaceae bacterium TSB47]